MKKYISSAFLIVVFATYALTKHAFGSDAVVVPPPASTSSAQADSSSSDSSVSSSSSSDSSAPTSPQSVPVTPPASSSPPQPVSSAPVSSAPPPPPPPASSSAPQGMYRNGTYTSPSEDAYYGNVQIQVTVKSGKIADVQFLDHPQDRGTSIEINSYAMPILQSEAIQSQSAPVDIASGATATSDAFNQALTSVLAQARN